MSDPSAEMKAAYRLLADGEWHDGGAVLRAIFVAVDPAKASRVALREREAQHVSPDYVAAQSMEDHVEYGRTRVAYDRMRGALDRGRFESDPAELTRAHWGGEEGWRVRDRRARGLGLNELAGHLGLGRAVVKTWIVNGDAPPPERTQGGFLLIPREHVPVYERLAKHYRPGIGLRGVDTKALWPPEVLDKQAPAPVRACPQCGAAIRIELRLEGT